MASLSYGTEEVLIEHEVCNRALRKFGLNPQGLPLYRVVRADTRKQWFGGEFAPKYPKYGGCWLLEVWQGPEKYGSRDDWEAAETLGPFPNKGDYEMSYAFLDEKEAYLPGEELAQFTAEMVERSKNVTRTTRWAQIQAEQEKAKEERMKKLRDMIADAAPLRGGVAVAKHADKLEEKSPVVRPTLAPGAGMIRGEQ